MGFILRKIVARSQHSQAIQITWMNLCSCGSHQSTAFHIDRLRALVTVWTWLAFCNVSVLLDLVKTHFTEDHFMFIQIKKLMWCGRSVLSQPVGSSHSAIWSHVAVATGRPLETLMLVASRMPDESGQLASQLRGSASSPVKWGNKLLCVNHLTLFLALCKFSVNISYSSIK